MKFTLNWLKEYLETDASLDEITERLTAIGLEVEEVDNPAETYAPFKVAEVTEAAPHPDADKLQVLKVKTEDQEGIQVVCGAPNARAGMKGIFAPDGSYVPGIDLTLKKTKIRGVESNGMMVSEREMNLSNEHDGIIELAGDTPVGTPASTIYGQLSDPIIEIGLTPNRGDCASIYGIARDLAAAGLGRLKKPENKKIKASFTSETTVTIKDTDGCYHFTGREIRNIKNGPSPEWLQNRLKAVGLRPISTLVDITNYFTHAFGRPLHVYDVDKLKGNIEVRKACGHEEIDALNDKHYTVDGDAVCIYDDSGIIGIGGIVGGVATSCDENTTNVFLEAANFSPQRIARAGRDMSILSDARYRFERGIDPEFTLEGNELATQMIIEICGNDSTQSSKAVIAGEKPDWVRHIEYKPATIESLVGREMPSDEQISILQRLGFQVSGAMNKAGPYDVKPPSWRPDIEGQADLAEEIIRIEGLDTIPSKSVYATDAVPTTAETPLLTRSRLARTALAARGMFECITWSFVAEDIAAQFGLEDDAQRATLKLVNAISSEMNIMRPSILPNLIESARNNTAQGYNDCALFEVGPTFEGTSPNEQKMQLAGIRTGSFAARHWVNGGKARPIDAYDAKTDALHALEAAGAPANNAQVRRDAPGYYHPGRSGSIALGKNVLAYFGEIHPAVLEQLNVKFPVAGFEILLENFPVSRSKGTTKPYLTLESLQPLTRDFAFLVDQKTAANDIIRAAKSGDKKLIKDAYIFDIYEGKNIETGKKSVALSVTIQPQGKSLTDEEIETIAKNVISAVEKKTGGALRG